MSIPCTRASMFHLPPPVLSDLQAHIACFHLDIMIYLVFFVVITKFQKILMKNQLLANQSSSTGSLFHKQVWIYYFGLFFAESLPFLILQHILLSVCFVHLFFLLLKLIFLFCGQSEELAVLTVCILFELFLFHVIADQRSSIIFRWWALVITVILILIHHTLQITRRIMEILAQGFVGIYRFVMQLPITTAFTCNINRLSLSL